MLVAYLIKNRFLHFKAINTYINYNIFSEKNRIPKHSIKVENTQHSKKRIITTNKIMAIYLCKNCQTYLTKQEELASKSFLAGQGQAYLFNSVENVACGPPKEINLLTGLFVISFIYCKRCRTTLGWKYEHAFEENQKYKESKFIVELALITIKEKKSKL